MPVIGPDGDVASSNSMPAFSRSQALRAANLLAGARCAPTRGSHRTPGAAPRSTLAGGSVRRMVPWSNRSLSLAGPEPPGNCALAWCTDMVDVANDTDREGARQCLKIDTGQDGDRKPLVRETAIDDLPETTATCQRSSRWRRDLPHRRSARWPLATRSSSYGRADASDDRSCRYDSARARPVVRIRRRSSSGVGAGGTCTTVSLQYVGIEMSASR